MLKFHTNADRNGQGEVDESNLNFFIAVLTDLLVDYDAYEVSESLGATVTTEPTRYTLLAVEERNNQVVLHNRDNTIINLTAEMQLPFWVSVSLARVVISSGVGKQMKRLTINLISR